MEGGEFWAGRDAKAIGGSRAPTMATTNMFEMHGWMCPAAS